MEARRALLEKTIQALGELAPIGDARQALELPVQMPVEAIDAGRLLDEALRDGKSFGGAGGEALGDPGHLGVEALRRKDPVDQADLESSLRVEARVESTSSSAFRKPTRRGRKKVELSAPVRPVFP